MKRLLSILICALLLLGTALPAFAAGPEPKITLQPQNAAFPEYSVASFTVKATGENLSCTWYIEYNGKTYNMSDNRNPQEPWEGYAGESYGGVQEDSGTFTWFFSGIGAELSGAKIWAVIEDGHYDVASEKAIITVQGSTLPPKIIDVPSAVSFNQGAEGVIRCVAASQDDSQLSYIWYETTTGKLQDIRAIEPEEDCDFLFVDTSKPGTRYYVCGIFTSKGGMAYSNVIAVTVRAVAVDPPQIKTKTLPDATVGKAYKVKLECTDKNAEFNVYYNPGHKNEFGDTNLYMADNGELSGTPKTAGTYTFTICAGGEGGEDYMEYTLKVKEPAASKPESSDKPQSSEEPASEPEPSLPEESPTEESIPEESALEDEPKEPGEFPLIPVLIGGGAGVAALGGGAAFFVLKFLLKK